MDGKPFKHYNAKFNRIVAKLNESKSKEVLEWGISKTEQNILLNIQKKEGKFSRY